MIFEGFEGPFSQSKLIKNRFQDELAMKCAPRRPQDVSRRLQDAPETFQDSQDGPKTAPGHTQDAPRSVLGRPGDAPGGSQDGSQERIYGGPLQNLDLGASWARFGKVLAWILRRVQVDFSKIFGMFGASVLPSKRIQNT